MSSSPISRPAAAVAGFLVVLVALGLVVSDAGHTQASHTGGMDAMSIDLDVTGNTATSLGPLDSCVEASPGDIVTVDVTATNIPAATAMIAFGYTILYDERITWVEAQDAQFLLAANPGSALMNVSQPTPDQDLSDDWTGAAADMSSVSLVPPEYGNGILQRLSVGIGQSAADGVYYLTLTGAAHIDAYNMPYAADKLNGASIAIGVPCPAVTGSPTPAPTPPAPTATPRPLPISVSFEPEAKLRLSDNSVTVVGTVTCQTPGPIYLVLVVHQVVKGVPSSTRRNR